MESQLPFEAKKKPASKILQQVMKGRYCQLLMSKSL
jgi:hypothetical protein